MADIMITNKNEISLIDIKDNRIKGITITKDGPKPIDYNTIKILNSLRIGNNVIKVKQVDEYDVYYDLDSKLYHYFKNGQEDLEKFIEANTKECLLYLTDKEDKKKSENRIMKIMLAGTIVCLVINCVTLKNLVTTNYNLEKNSSIYIATGADFDIPLDDLINSDVEGIYDPITANRIHELIINNPNLTEDEIAYLDNEQLFNDLMPYIEESSFKYILEGRLANLRIESYEKEEEPNALGYYANDDVIHVLHYDKDNLPGGFKDTLAHEFVHVLQSNYVNSYLIEGLAEIISDEYFDNTSINAYPDCVVNDKLLMEVIGPAPVLRSMVTNDFSHISNELRLCLDSKDVSRIEELFSIEHANTNENAENIHKEIRELLQKAYEYKYGERFSDDILYAMAMGQYNRYYFNTQYRDEQALNNCTYVATTPLDIRYAYDNNLVDFRTNEVTTITYEEYKQKPTFIMGCYFSVDHLTVLDSSILVTDLQPSYEIVGNLDVANSMVTYTKDGNVCHDTVDDLYNQGLIDVQVPFINTKFYSYSEYENLDSDTKHQAIRPNIKYESMIYVRNDINTNTVYFADADEPLVTIDLPPLPGCEYTITNVRN